MPLYAYRCDDCGKQFETLVRSGETPECPVCQSAHLARQLSLIAKPASGGEAGAEMAACDGAGGCGMCPGMAAMAGACG
ncbi:MAG: zinc ribbon domain-containing protein [Hyphomicrobiales bacterium]|nr:zinc ribbon domain-containing protein [Hyphomicrobiales bacterium]